MVGILVAESDMDFLFCRDSITSFRVVSYLRIDHQWRYSKHGKEKYVCFYIFHKNVLLIINRLSLIINHYPTIPDFEEILRKDKYPCQEAGTNSVLIQNDGL